MQLLAGKFHLKAIFLRHSLSAIELHDPSVRISMTSPVAIRASKLHKTASNGDLEEIESLIKQCFPVDYPCEARPGLFCQAPLIIFAAMNGELAAVRLLVAHGSIASTGHKVLGYSALAVAVGFAREDVVSYLLERRSGMVSVLQPYRNAWSLRDGRRRERSGKPKRDPRKPERDDSAGPEQDPEDPERPPDVTNSSLSSVSHTRILLPVAWNLLCTNLLAHLAGTERRRHRHRQTEVPHGNRLPCPQRYHHQG